MNGQVKVAPRHQQAAGPPPSCYPLHGLVPILNTPFDANLDIDFASVERLVEQTIARGAVGCIVPAVASEVDKLSMAERRRLVEQVVGFVKGRIQVIAGVSADDLAATRELVRHAVAAGCDGILCRAPEALQGRDADLLRYFHDLGDSGAAMLMIQDLDWRGYGLELDLICRMFEQIKAFRCLKVEVAPAGVKYSQVLERTGGRLHVSGGWALPQMIEALDRGVHALCTTAVNTPFHHVYQWHHAGKRQEALDLFTRIVPYLAWSHQHIDISIQFLKHYCRKRGWFTTANCRAPMLAYDAYHQRCGAELIEQIIAIEDALPPAR